MTPLCLTCQTLMRRARIGVTFEVRDGPDPWKKVQGDVYRCGCGHEVATGFGRPVECWEPRYEGMRADGGHVWQTAEDKARAYAEELTGVGR